MPLPPEFRSRWTPLRYFVWVVGLLFLLALIGGISSALLSSQVSAGHTTTTNPPCGQNCTPAPAAGSSQLSPLGGGAGPYVLWAFTLGVLFVLWLTGSVALAVRRQDEVLRAPPERPATPPASTGSLEEEDDPLAHML